MNRSRDLQVWPELWASLGAPMGEAGGLTLSLPASRGCIPGGDWPLAVSFPPRT